VLAVVGLSGRLASAQLRIATYNTATSGDDTAPDTPRDGMDTVLRAIGDEIVGGIFRPIDILALQEQASFQTSTQAIADILNGRLTMDAATTGAKMGEVTVTSSSQSVANGDFSESVSYDVLDHANGSFANWITKTFSKLTLVSSLLARDRSPDHLNCSISSQIPASQLDWISI